MKIHWQENGIVVTLVAVAVVALLVVAEFLVERRAQSPIVVTIEAGTAGEDEGDESEGPRLATVPLYASPAELSAGARLVLADPKPNVDLLHELARQARTFRSYELADTLLARCLELAPGRVDSLFLRARTQSDLGHAEMAAKMYADVLALSPNHQKATYNLGVLARRAGDYQRAESMLGRAIAISSGRIKSKALQQLGLTHGAMGQWESAANEFREAASLRPDRARLWLDLGNAELQLDRLGEAQAAYDKALALDKRLADAHLAMGQLQDLRGNHAGALLHLSRAVRLDSDDTRYQMALARHYLARGETAKARAAFEGLARSAGSEADRAYANAMLALLSRDGKRMLAELKRADALHPGGYDDGVEQAAIALFDLKQYADARTLLDMLLARPNPSPELMLAAARTASRLEQWAEAESLLRRSVKARPENSEAWFQLGRVLSERGDLAGAIDAYRSSLARNPDARNTKLNLAVVEARAGNEGEALRLYAQLLKSHPRYAPALLNRARLHERAGRIKEAEADLQAAIRVAPTDTGIRERLARLLLGSGETGRARSLLSDAVAESPADAEIRLLLAEAELRSGNRANAIRELDRAASLAGDDRNLWKRLAQAYRDAGEITAATRANSRAGSKP
jgi:tetratricopeptide (TPR) repeat protein